MDTRHVDELARILARAGTRRGLLALLAALPLLGGVANLLAPGEAGAKGRRQRRKDRHKRRKAKRRRGRKRKRQQKTCRSKSRAKVCAGRCGIVKNAKTCKKKINCGPCSCDPPCPTCRVCDGVTNTCIPDPGKLGDDCGTPGQVCQADGGCACDVCSAGCQFDTAQAAIDAASAGAAIHLCPGTYGSITIDKDLTLIGTGQGANPDSDSILDGQGAHRTVFVVSGTVDLADVHITGGLADGAAGVGNTGHLTLTDCTVTGNTADGLGGGLYNAEFGSLRLVACTVTGNSADMGGGIYQDSEGEVTLVDTLVAGNSATVDGGGGIYVTSGPVMITGSDITDNTAENGGGGLYICPDGEVSFDDTSTVTLNESLNGTGGGIFLSPGGTINLNDATVADNEPDDCSGLMC